jgi:hypothetical protein
VTSQWLLEKATLDYWSPKNADKAREFVQKYTKELADLVMAEVAVRKLGFGHPYLYSIYFSLGFALVLSFILFVLKKLPLHQGTSHMAPSI